MPPRKRKAPDAASETSSNSGAGPSYCWKKPDGVPLLRQDLQHDLLSLIFTSTAFRFTPPSYPSTAAPLFPTDRTWSFAELYLDCLSNSAKANKNLKDKMSESTEYAVNFAKLCLLINVGRFNTTLAFYPEMKTVLRTYHSIPSMQLNEYTRKNLQDAPRMKAQLKGCCLPDEESPPDSLAEIIRRGTELNKIPPTSVVELVFLLFAEPARMTEKYFPPGFSMTDLFSSPAEISTAIPSEQRAHAILWLVHRFLEAPSQVAADFSNGEAKLPTDSLLKLERRDCAGENVDTQAELDFAAEMRATRENFLEKYRLEERLREGAGADATPGLARADSSSVFGGTPAPGDGEGTPLPAEKQARGARPGRDYTPTMVRTASRLSTPMTGPSAKRSRRSPGASGSRMARPVSPLPLAYAETSIAISDGTTLTSANTKPPPLVLGQLPSIAIGQHNSQRPFKLAKLVPAGDGIADEKLLGQWAEFAALESAAGSTLLQLAWGKVKRDLDVERDPVYDSEDEDTWTPNELGPRLLGFQFRNFRTGAKDVLPYEGPRPEIEPGLLLTLHARRTAAGPSVASINGALSSDADGHSMLVHRAMMGGAEVEDEIEEDQLASSSEDELMSVDAPSVA